MDLPYENHQASHKETDLSAIMSLVLVDFHEPIHFHCIVQFLKLATLQELKLFIHDPCSLLKKYKKLKKSMQ